MMIFGRSEHKRSNPYVVLTIGALAMIGAFHVVKCTKNSVKCVKNKIKHAFKDEEIYASPIGE